MKYYKSRVKYITAGNIEKLVTLYIKEENNTWYRKFENETTWKLSRRRPCDTLGLIPMTKKAAFLEIL